MLFNLQMEGANNGGSEQAGSSDDGQIVAALRKMMRKEMEVMVINTVQTVIVPMIENLIRKVVKEVIQSAQQKFLHCGERNDAHEINMCPESRSLQLKFLDEVSHPVLTGKEIKGKGGTAMRLAVVDKTTGELVDSGPEASAKVEILVLQPNHDDNEQDWSVEDFNSRIIGESDKKKPHFANRMYVYLKEGIGFLCNVKLGHDSSWTKSCECRLGARVVDNVSRSAVKEAWTELFMVQDSRSKLYEKHYPPSLFDDVWRLENIGKDGPPCKRLRKGNIRTVWDFLFLLSIDPQRLQKMVGAGSKMWKATVDHARKCIIDDKKIYLYSSPSKFKVVVTFDAVGQLRGILRDSHYIPLDNLSEVDKASAHKLLLLAFENRDDITSMDDETSLVHQFPYEPNDIFAATNFTLESSQGSDLTVSNCIDEYDPTAPGTSSQTIDPPISHSNFFGILGSENTKHLRVPSLAVPDQCSSSSLTGLGSDQGSSYPSIDVFSWFEHFGDNEPLISLISHCDNLSETLGDKSHSDQQSNAGSIRLFAAAALMVWLFRVRKRAMGFGDIQVPKRQRIG